MKQPDTIIKLTLIYTLNKIPIEILDKVLIRELQFDEKLDVLMSLSEDRMKNILKNMRVNAEFLIDL